MRCGNVNTMADIFIRYDMLIHGSSCTKRGLAVTQNTQAPDWWMDGRWPAMKLDDSLKTEKNQLTLIRGSRTNPGCVGGGGSLEKELLTAGIWAAGTTATRSKRILYKYCSLHPHSSHPPIGSQVPVAIHFWTIRPSSSSSRLNAVTVRSPRSKGSRWDSEPVFGKPKSSWTDYNLHPAGRRSR